MTDLDEKPEGWAGGDQTVWSRSMVTAIDYKTGKVRWDVEGFRAGTVTLAGDRLLIVKEGGELVMAAASPAGFQAIATAKVLPPVVRSYPAIANGRMYLRNEKTLICLSLK